jgi:hypothetical protein
MGVKSRESLSLPSIHWIRIKDFGNVHFIFSEFFFEISICTREITTLFLAAKIPRAVHASANVSGLWRDH